MEMDMNVKLNEEALKSHWEDVIQTTRLLSGATDVSFDTWLRPLRIGTVEENTVCVVVPDPNFIGYIQKKFGMILEHVISEIMSIKAKVEFMSEDDFKMKTTIFVEESYLSESKKEFFTIISGLKKLNGECKVFFKNNEKLIESYSERTDLNADEYLYQQVLVNLAGELAGVQKNIEFFDKRIVRTGKLNRNDLGRICIDDEPIRYDIEFEVLVQDPDLERLVWYRTGIKKGNPDMLLGLEEINDIKGLKTRIRE